MTRANRFWLTGICTVLLLSGAAHWFHIKPVHAQQNYGDSDDGNIYVYASIDVDSNYNLYTESYTELDFDADEDIDYVGDEMQVDEDGSVGFDDYADADPYYSEYPQTTFGPVDTGHSYGVASIGYVCVDDYDDEDEDDDCYWYPDNDAYASVYVASIVPHIDSISPSTVHPGDTDTLTITGSNFIENASDQLTLNFNGSGSPFTLVSTPATCTSQCTATFSYSFPSSYQTNTYTISLTNNEGTSNGMSFTVAPLLRHRTLAQ